MTFPDFSANLGNHCTASQVTPVPKLRWNCDLDALYTIIMFDCDPLGQQTRLLAEVSHWVVGNVKKCDINTGQVLTDWHPSSPPDDTGDHRYVFLVFKHKKEIVFEEPFIRNV